MALFQLSPGVLTTEKDFTTIVPAVATTAGGMVGTFAWGPAEEFRLIDSENRLKSVFHEPDANTYEWWFSAANFLQYGNNLQVVRAIASTHKNAVAASGANTALLVKNREHYDANYADGSANAGHWAAKYPGSLGNSLKVGIADAGANAAAYTAWSYSANFDGRPGTSTYAAGRGASNDEMHVIVVDEDGLFTGTAGQVLEKFAFVSKAADGKKDNGEGNYYVDIINNQSQYIWWLDHKETNWGTNANVGGTATAYTVMTPLNESLGNAGGAGVDGNAAVTDANWQTGAAKFANADEIDIQLFVGGPGRPHAAAAAGTANWTYMVDSIAATRKDCVVFLSPEYADVVNQPGSEVTNITNASANGVRDVLSSSSYAVMDCNWKKQYDRYNDVFRWVPMNGDTAGLCVRTDTTDDPWYSPAGFTRGQVKNVLKLAWQPTKTERDAIYKVGVNPVVSFPGEGTVLFGDKTMLLKPSAFDRINVRRLFLVLEKSIAIAAKYSLFEFNDEFTRAQFKGMIDPFLRDVQGRRGIFDYKVVCDSSNNPSTVVDRNEFIADIYIKPARTINYIFLNFIATRSGVSFNEVGG